MGRRGKGVRQPEQEIRFTGIVWQLPSRDAASEAATQIRKLRDEVSLGAYIEDANVFPIADKKKQFVVLIGLGTMFDGTFIARCVRFIEAHHGTEPPESKKKNLIACAREQWRILQAQERREIRQRANSTESIRL